MSCYRDFWGKVNKTSLNECWIWNGSKRPGRVTYGSAWKDGKLHPAHRVSWELSYGKIKEGMFVLHKCDVGLCVNPNHLFLGTHLDNMRDMVSKGRHLRPRQLI